MKSNWKLDDVETAGIAGDPSPEGAVSAPGAPAEAPATEQLPLRERARAAWEERQARIEEDRRKEEARDRERLEATKGKRAAVLQAQLFEVLGEEADARAMRFSDEEAGDRVLPLVDIDDVTFTIVWSQNTWRLAVSRPCSICGKTFPREVYSLAELHAWLQQTPQHPACIHRQKIEEQQREQEEEDRARRESAARPPEAEGLAPISPERLAVALMDLLADYQSMQTREEWRMG